MSIFTNSIATSVEEAAEYTQAVLGVLGDRDPLEVLRTTPAALRTLVVEVSPDLLAAPEADGKWSIRMVAQHLADSELVWGWRLRMIFAQDRPAITGYDQDAWATRLGYNDVPIEHALDDFELLRGSNLRLLARMPESDQVRVGVHSERGEESVAHLMRLYAGHDLLHIAQIDRIKKALSAVS